MMRKYRCPQCDIPSMYVKNADGERLLVYVYENGEVVPKILLRICPDLT